MTDRAELARLFVAHIAKGAGDAGDLDPDRGQLVALEALLVRCLAEAREAWVAFRVEDEPFVLYLAARVTPTTDLTAAVETLAVTDLYLACACASGDPGALAVFDGWFAPIARGAVRRVNESDAFGDDVIQSLRQRLLVREGDRPPRIATYAGTGPLAAWLRVAATREALLWMRRHGREVPTDDDALFAGVEHAAPELTYIKRQYRDQVQRAFRQAFDVLSGRDRNLLRLYYADGLNIDAIGAVYKVHGSTISRRLARARDAVFEETKRLLREQLAMSSHELAQLVADVRSQLDLSLSALFTGH